MRRGSWIQVVDQHGNSGWGESSPLPSRSQESLEDSMAQFHRKQGDILNMDWTAQNCWIQLTQLQLLPSLLFGLESALLSMLVPLSEYTLPASALLMGSPPEILAQAQLRKAEGFISAKLKVGQLTFEEAAQLIFQLKDQFRLRIDVNRAWNTEDSLRFFAQFPEDTFDYVEEPFQNPHDLAQFSHPLAVDESFPQDLSVTQLENLSALKALIYKPTIQGGMLGCLPLYRWAIRRRVSLVLSSSFESDLGLAAVSSIAHRLSLREPIGVGTSLERF